MPVSVSASWNASFIGRVCADDGDLATDELSSRLWEQQRQRIKAVEDKYRWKLNEHGVRTSAVRPHRTHMYQLHRCGQLLRRLCLCVDHDRP